MTSIRRRLLVWLLSASLMACALAGAFTYYEAREEVDELFDRQLRQVALSLRHQEVFLPAASGGGPGSEEEDDVVVQVWNREGVLAYASRPGVLPPRSSRSGFGTVSRDGDRWRLFVLTEPARTIQVAQPLSARREISAGIAMSLLAPSLALIPALGILIWIAVGRGLRPLAAVAAGVGRRNPSAMEPLPERNLPKEIAPLVRELNDLLERLSQAMEAQHRFVADAAHELRTPLAAVDLQLQIVERSVTAEEKAAAMARLKGGIHRASRLVQQLLTMARLEPEATPHRLTRLDLADLVRTSVAEWSPAAQEKGIDLGLAHADPARIDADAEQLQILLGNLIDNAIRYTPEGGRVDVGLLGDETGARIVVEDNGPGIPEREMTRVFDRFYRCAGTGAPGSGLGLAIVRKIAERLGGRVTLEAGHGGRGLRATVRFGS
ncbi:MAG: ATP-binding protein [Deltaproteobacteria bacterium]|nr:ATP-binding protein [Deltaproteobacteria bacterium]